MINRHMVHQALSHHTHGPTTAEFPVPGTIVEVPDVGPLYWVSDGKPDMADILRARSTSAASGLWPLVVDGGGSRTVTLPTPTGPEERTHHWLGDGRPPRSVRIDPESWLADQWADLMAEEEAGDDPRSERLSTCAPDGTRWPGLAPVGSFRGDSGGSAIAMTDHILRNEWLDDPRLVLIPATSSSEALEVGRCTMSEENDLTGHAAVLRSWEQRLGAQLIALRFDTMFVSVEAPPREKSAATHIACEHVSFAPDGVQQNFDSFPEYVEHLVGADLWGFWWD
jgi:hypothetical protein